MSKGHFIGMLIILLAVIFSASAVKANGLRNGATQKTVKAFLLYATPVAVPERNTNDPFSPEIKPIGSFSHVQTSLHVRVNHILFCLFEITFQKTYSEYPRPQIDIALNRFLLTLLNDFIAPNAP